VLDVQSGRVPTTPRASANPVTGVVTSLFEDLVDLITSAEAAPRILLHSESKAEGPAATAGPSR